MKGKKRTTTTWQLSQEYHVSLPELDSEMFSVQTEHKAGGGDVTLADGDEAFMEGAPRLSSKTLFKLDWKLANMFLTSSLP